MKQGKNIVELAQELQARSEEKQDFIANTQELQLVKRDLDWALRVPTAGEFHVTDHAHRQISDKMGIPFRYYRRMMEKAPALLEENVDHWMTAEPSRNMVRTLRGDARAFLSDRYRRIDNEQIAEAALPALLESGQIEVVSSEITDTKMYIQARFPRLEGEVKVGDPVQHGLIITNSEVGAGSLSIRPMIYRLVCTNGMVTGSTFSEGRIRQTHLGRRLDATEDYSVYTDETLEADDRALMLKIRDSIKALSDPELFFKLMEQMRAAANTKPVENPVDAVERLGKAFQLPKNDGDSILERLIRDQDYTKWGMLNAVTNLANDTDSYDRAVELEELGGKILTLPNSQWEKIAA